MEDWMESLGGQDPGSGSDHNGDSCHRDSLRLPGLLELHWKSKSSYVELIGVRRIYVAMMEDDMSRSCDSTIESVLALL